MNDLLEKLEAALDQTEQIARDALDEAPWEARNADADGIHMEDPWVGYRDELGTVATGMRADQAIHIALNDPKRILRRVARDRKLLDLHLPLFADRSYTECASCHGSYSDYPCPTIKALAEDYEIEVGS